MPKKWLSCSPDMKSSNIKEIKSIMAFMKSQEVEAEETYGTTFGKVKKRSKTKIKPYMNSFVVTIIHMMKKLMNLIKHLLIHSSSCW